MFPFQNGSIKSEELEEMGFETITFPFQNGSIKRLDLLKDLVGAELFPFQNGSIKSRLEVQKPAPEPTRFHSKMVRLKGYNRHNFTLTEQLVSIPKWFD